MSEAGFIGGELQNAALENLSCLTTAHSGSGLGLFGIVDVDGHAVGASAKYSDAVEAKDAGAAAIKEALEDEEGTPDFVLVCMPPGLEEHVLRGIDSVLEP